MYIYTVIYIHICMHAFIPTYIHTYIHTVHMYIHTDVRTYGGKGQHSWMQISVNIHTFHLQSLWQLAGMSTLSRRLDCKSEVLHRARSDLRAIRRFSSSWSWLPTILTSRAFLTWPVRRLVDCARVRLIDGPEESFEVASMIKGKNTEEIRKQL